MGILLQWFAVPLVSLTYLAGVAIAALASLVVAAWIAVYLIRNSPRTFLSFRKLRPEPDEDDYDHDE